MFVKENFSNLEKSWLMFVRNFKSASNMISLEMLGNKIWLKMDRKNKAPL